jgi:glycosyltransferase involved in cell wall biosynthesis
VKICQLVEGLNVGGLERMVESLSLGLAHRGYTVSVCCYDELGPGADLLNGHGVPVNLVRRRPGIDWRLPPKIAKYLRLERCDILHCHNETAFFYGFLAAKIAGVQVVYTEHSLTEEKRIREIVHSLFFRGTSMIVGVAEEIRERLAREEGAPRGKSRVIWNGRDGDIYSVREKDFIRKKREELGIPPEAFIIGAVGRHFPEKNYGMLLKILSSLRQEFETVLLMVGGGPLMDEFLRKAAEVKVRDYVFAMGDRSDAQDLYPVFDVFVLSSVREGMPLVVIEAMACGIPVVSTDVGGIRNIVQEGNTGFLVPSGDVPAMVNRIMGLKADPAMRESFGRRAREYFEQYLSLDRMIDQYDDIYQEIAGSRT